MNIVDPTYIYPHHHNIDVLPYQHYDTINSAVGGNHLTISYFGDIDYNLITNLDQYYLNILDTTV